MGSNDVISMDPDEGMPIEAKLLLEMRTHRTESRMQFEAMDHRFESMEQRMKHQEEATKELTDTMTWGKGALRGLFWLGGFSLAMWAVATDALGALADLIRLGR